MPKNRKQIARLVFLTLLGIAIGVLFSSQSKSVGDALEAFNRESRLNVFKEMQIVKDSNHDLRLQIEELQEELENSTNQENALETVRREIEKYSIIAGNVGIEGPGVGVLIDKNMEALWFTDLVNELYTAGAEAVSINGIRLTDENVGFFNMPNRQVLLGGDILSAPYEILAIGDAEGLYDALTLKGGLVSRINQFLPEHQVTVEKLDDVKIVTEI